MRKRQKYKSLNYKIIKDFKTVLYLRVPENTIQNLNVLTCVHGYPPSTVHIALYIALR